MKVFDTILRRTVVALGCACLAWPVLAADADPVIARNSAAVVTQSELETEIDVRVPADKRDEFLADPKRVGEIVHQALRRKSLAAQARQLGVDKTPEFEARMRLETDRALAEFRVAAIEKDAARAFDAKLAQQTALARERYLADRGKYKLPEEVDASHILFDARKRPPDDARRMAEAARARIAAGADFAAVARELSEDPTTGPKGGSLGWFTRDKAEPAFANAVFAMKTVGEVSQPVQTRFGWHLIRLDGRRDEHVRPFDEVREQIVGEMREAAISKARDAEFAKIGADPRTSVNEPALDAIVAKARARHFGAANAPQPAGSAQPTPAQPKP